MLVVSLALAGLILVERRVPLELRKSHNVALGVVYGAINVTFAVIAGFSAFLVLDKYTTAQDTVTREAGDVTGIYRLAEQFPETQRHQIQKLAKSYTQVVVEEEWPMMSNGQTSSRADTLVNDLGRGIEISSLVRALSRLFTHKGWNGCMIWPKIESFVCLTSGRVCLLSCGLF